MEEINNGIEIGDVVQFNENHKWCGCLGIVTEKKSVREGIRMMVGIPVPQERNSIHICNGQRICDREDRRS